MKTIEMPARIAALPRDEKGRPVPAFVQWIDGKPEFRVASANHYVACIKRELCWVCGQKLGRFRSFVIGPMCGINHTSSEPPSHWDCARYSVQACPFMSTPEMHRRETDMPEGTAPAFGGVSIRRNPGVMLIWTTMDPYFVQDDGAGGRIIRFGAADLLEFYREGRTATRAEIDESIQSGLPFLLEAAGPDEAPMLEKYLANFVALLPA